MSPDNTHGRQYEQPKNHRLLWIIASQAEKIQKLEARLEQLERRELHRKQANQ